MEKDRIVTLENPEHTQRLQRDPKDLQPSGKKRWWAWPLTLALLGFGGYELYQTVNKQKDSAAKTGKAGKKGDRNVPVVTVGARRGDMPVYLTGLGSATAFNTVTVKSRVDGQLIKVSFQEGQFVNEGDLLAEIDPRPYQQALDQAQAALAKDTAMVTQAQAALARDQSQVKYAQAEAGRYNSLMQEGVVSKEQNDNIQTTLGTQQQTVNADMATIASLQAALGSDRANIETAKINLSYCFIHSPIAGRVGLRLMDQGNIVHASDATGMLVITQVKPIAVLFTIPEDNLQVVLKSLRSGAHLPVDAFDRDFRTKLASGTLLTVDNTIDQSTGTSKLKAVFNNDDFALFPNQFVNVRMLVDTKKDAIIVPAAAVQRGPQGTFAYVVNEEKKAEIRSITVGTSEGNDVAVDKGLEVSELVVVDGADKLQDGSRVDNKIQGQDGGGASPRTPKAGRGKKTQAAE
jgi:multidrug efflux system membrane fusion protein